MKRIYFSFFSILLACILFNACNPSSIPPESPNGFTVKVTKTAGENWGTNQRFLGLPANLGEVLKIQNLETKCLILSRPLKPGIKLEVEALGVLRLDDEGTDLNIIVSYPVDPTLQTIKAQSLDDFATIHSSSKWIIEQWFLNYKGLGKVKLKGWETSDYVVNNLLKK